MRIRVEKTGKTLLKGYSPEKSDNNAWTEFELVLLKTLVKAGYTTDEIHAKMPRHTKNDIERRTNVKE